MILWWLILSINGSALFFPLSFFSFFFYTDTSIVPPLIYAMMGTSRDLVIGAVAIDSLLLSSMILESYPGVDAINYKKTVLTTTLFAGVFQTACGVFRLVMFLIIFDWLAVLTQKFVLHFLFCSPNSINRLGGFLRIFCPMLPSLGSWQVQPLSLVFNS